jgi:hypothetical protein
VVKGVRLSDPVIVIERAPTIMEDEIFEEEGVSGASTTTPQTAVSSEVLAKDMLASERILQEDDPDIQPTNPADLWADLDAVERA